MVSFVRSTAGVLAFSIALAFAGSARAGLFDDAEARRAILELRAQLAALNDQTKVREADAAATLAQMQRNLLDMNNQLEATRAELARMRGQQEQLARDVSELQRAAKDIRQGVDDRIRRLEPQTVSVDGRDFQAEPDEIRLYDEAVAVLRKGSFAPAADQFTAFIKRYPSSGYSPTALFWLGNAQYGKRDHKEAINSFRQLVSRYPDHPRTPEALLSIASSQTDLKDARSARRTLDELIKAYPKSEAAVAARERLAAMK